MPIVEQLMDLGSFDVELDPDTPTSVLDDIDVRTRLWATYVHTPVHWEPAELSDADMLSQCRYAGRFIGMGPQRLSIEGEGILGWLGRDGDGGNLYSGPDTTVTGLDLEGHLDARVFASSNGLTKGNVNNDSTTFAQKREGGDTRLEQLDTIAAMAVGGPYYYRVNSSTFTIDVDTLATLWPTNTTPTAIVSEEGGGPEGTIDGLHAVIELEGVDGSEVRTGARVDYADGVANGSATASLPATYGNLVGGSPVDLLYMDWRPKRPRPPTERHRKVAVWGINSQARADVVAQREVNERTLVRPQLRVNLIEVIDPWRYDITPGNAVWVDSMRLGLTSTVNEVGYRGEIATPAKERVEEMTTPLYDGGGHYLRCWDGVSAFEWIDLTRFVIPEDGPVELLMNHRTSFPVDARRRRMTSKDRRAWRRRSRLAAALERMERAG